MGGSRPATPASPKVHRPKAQEPGIPLYGCEHLRLLITKSPDSASQTIRSYKKLLQVIFDNTPIISQTSKSSDSLPITSLTPNYLCLQCSATCTTKDRPKHGALTKHRLYADSRSGGVFCQMCNDFVWDPTLEESRVRKLGTLRKRKHDELFTEAVKEDPKYISANTTAAPCRIVGLRGMYNMGATCFMSVILQSFIHNPLLRNFYLGDGHRTGNCTQEDCLNCGMDELFQDFYAQDTTAAYAASNLLSISWQAQQKTYLKLVGDDEKDAHEYFQFLTEELHQTSKAPFLTTMDYHGISGETDISGPCNCIVHQTFYGSLQSTVTCQHCGTITTSIQPFLDLSLGVANIVKKRAGKLGKEAQKAIQSLTLQKCLDTEYLQPEQCDYNCHSCHSSENKGRRQSAIKRLPNVLCIQFKRFEHHKEAKTSSKLETKIQFPLQISMLPYTNRARSQDIRENFELARSCTYDLLSVVVHMGSMNTGHYIAYSRVGNQWFMFDDHKVTLATEAQAFAIVMDPDNIVFEQYLPGGWKLIRL